MKIAKSAVVLAVPNGVGTLFGLLSSYFVFPDENNVAVCINKSSDIHRAIEEAGQFVMNLLGQNQEQLARSLKCGYDYHLKAKRKLSDSNNILEIDGSQGIISCEVVTSSSHDEYTVFHAKILQRKFSQSQPLLEFNGDLFGLFTLDFLYQLPC